MDKEIVIDDAMYLIFFPKKTMEELILRTQNYVMAKGYNKKEYPYLAIFGTEIMSLIDLALDDMDMHYASVNYFDEYPIENLVILRVSDGFHEGHIYIHMEKVGDKYRFSHFSTPNE